MKKWRKFVGIAAASLSLLSLSPSRVQAYDCCWNLCDLCFDIGVDFLWWKPCIDELDYAAEITAEGESPLNYKSLCPEWEPGVRVRFGFPNFGCNWGLIGSYVYLNSNDSSSISEDNSIVSHLVHPGLFDPARYDSADASWDLCYHEWDALISTDISCHSCHTFHPFVGVAGINLEQKFDVVLKSDAPKVNMNWDSDYWGVGLRAGTNYTFAFSPCLTFFANAHGTLLAGDACSKNKQSQGNNDPFVFEDDDHCHFVPGYRIATGLLYDASLCNWDFAFRLGYEFLGWHNLPNPRTFIGETLEGAVASHSTSNSVRTLGYHGLLVGMNMRF